MNLVCELEIGIKNVLITNESNRLEFVVCQPLAKKYPHFQVVEIWNANWKLWTVKFDLLLRIFLRDESEIEIDCFDQNQSSDFAVCIS